MSENVAHQRKPTSGKKVRDAFYRRYGRAMAAWAEIEQALSFWFLYLCSPQWQQAHLLISVFYSPAGFKNSYEMLKTAFSMGIRERDEEEFFREAMIRVKGYYHFRNKLAHHLVRYDKRDNSIVLYPPKDMLPIASPITDSHLVIATRNFRRLARIFLNAVPNPQSPPRLSAQEALAHVRALPSEAHSNALSPKQLGRLRQLRARQGSRG